MLRQMSQHAPRSAAAPIPTDRTSPAVARLHVEVADGGLGALGEECHAPAFRLYDVHCTPRRYTKHH